jgi:hemerythrin-like metal-binding protein
LLKDLVAYTKMHFNFEERTLELYGYPQLPDHKTSHENLVKKAQDFTTRFEAGTANLSIELLDFLKHWLNHHILKEDMAYSGFLRAKIANKQ